MQLFDTHCHFESSNSEEIACILKRAAEAGVTRILAVGGSTQLNATALLAKNFSLAEGMPEVLAALGYDRDNATSHRTLPEIDHSKAVAIGEIGLDFHYNRDTRHDQIELFLTQLFYARKVKKPVIIHTREADEDTLQALNAIPSRGIIHSFTGSVEFAKKLLNLGFFISLSGIVTFRAADNVREVLKALPLDRLLIETDSPYLAPVPMRGSCNEPAFVVHTARFVAEFLSMSIEDIAERTTCNAIRALDLV